MKFFKYQSLGNDFVLIDAMNNQTLWSSLTKNDIIFICHRHFGVGADGVLVITEASHHAQVQCKIFNADGCQAELCINGVRCVAHYLFTQCHFSNQFELHMNNRLITCQVKKQHYNTIHITLNTGKAESCVKKTIQVSNKSITGDVIQFSNPHFVLFKRANVHTLLTEGQYISKHSDFPHQTNVAYVSPTKAKNNSYDISFYERGVGITLSCGSGVSAVMWALYQHKKITPLTPITLKMQGGGMQSYIDQDNQVIQEATAALIFSGTGVRLNDSKSTQPRQ